MCLMEHQGVPKKTVTRQEEHCCHHRIALPPKQGIWVLTPAEGMCHGISRLKQEPGVYSRLKAGMAIRNSTCFREVRIPVFLGRTPQEAKLGLAG